MALLRVLIITNSVRATANFQRISAGSFPSCELILPVVLLRRDNAAWRQQMDCVLWRMPFSLESHTLRSRDWEGGKKNLWGSLLLKMETHSSQGWMTVMIWGPQIYRRLETDYSGFMPASTTFEATNPCPISICYFIRIRVLSLCFSPSHTYISFTASRPWQIWCSPTRQPHFHPMFNQPHPLDKANLNRRVWKQCPSFNLPSQNWWCTEKHFIPTGKRPLVLPLPPSLFTPPQQHLRAPNPKQFLFLLDLSAHEKSIKTQF